MPHNLHVHQRHEFQILVIAIGIVSPTPAEQTIAERFVPGLKRGDRIRMIRSYASDSLAHLALCRLDGDRSRFPDRPVKPAGEVGQPLE